MVEPRLSNDRLSLAVLEDGRDAVKMQRELPGRY
jgi:hypothetical protein